MGAGHFFYLISPPVSIIPLRETKETNEFFCKDEETRLGIGRSLLAVFIYNQCFSSVTMPASLLYQASILKEYSFA